VTDRRKALVVGGSRGIGAASALRLAEAGLDVLITYRARREKGLAVAERASAYGVAAAAIPLDICCADARVRLVHHLQSDFSPLAAVLLSASGGMEPNMPPDYPAQINTLAPAALAQALAPVLAPDASLLYLTSHEAHFHDPARAHPAYGAVAESKQAGEARIQALRSTLGGRATLKIISADVVEDTVTAKLLSRLADNAVERRRQVVGRLPTADDVAREVVRRHREPSAWGEVSYVWTPTGYPKSN
jgi:NAD(P)-dependent dehydrogenase (short-subunit alcohol dehydrogenase family)